MTSLAPKTRRAPLLARVAAATAFALFGSGLVAAGPPEIVRVRVPSEQVPKWFPPGSELRGLHLEEFEALVKKAQPNLGRAEAGQDAKLLRALPAAKWEAGP